MATGAWDCATVCTLLVPRQNDVPSC